MAKCLISLGANLGDRGATLQSALQQLATVPQTSLLAQSSFRETKPAGGPQQAAYLNAAATLETTLSPQQLLAELQHIESELGRVRTEHWGPRTIDLDLLLYDRLELETPELTLPHPRMSFRRFVLEPAAEIAAEMVYPINGWTIGRLLTHAIQATFLIELAPTFSPWSAHAPARKLLQALVVRPDVDPATRELGLKGHDLTPKERSRAKKRLQAGKKALLEPSLQRRPTARWLVIEFWDVQLVYETYAHLPTAVAEVTHALQDREPGKLVVVWDPHESAATQLLNKVRHLPDCPPVLWLPPTHSLEQAAAEVIAAMAAME